MEGGREPLKKPATTAAKFITDGIAKLSVNATITTTAKKRCPGFSSDLISTLGVPHRVGSRIAE
jgi:hypothetical protein